jgi:ATP:corrinoid adenosyltransferase
MDHDYLLARYPAIVAVIEDSVIVTGTVRESAAIELAALVAEVERLRAEREADREMLEGM